MDKQVDPSDLRRYAGEPITDALVTWRGHLWYAKASHGEPWRDVFAFYLGRKWLNIAEVAFVDGVQGALWKDGRPFESQSDSSLVLVRIANTEDLQVADLDQAMAAELVFSMWIRRRDAHPWNRAYVSGLPIFFDHGIAFGAEPANLAISSFFRVGSDGGYAGRWRVRELEHGTVPTTAGERTFSGGAMAIHRVRHLSGFSQLLLEAVASIRAIEDRELVHLAKLARVPTPEILVEFLRHTRGRLDDEVIQLQEVLGRDDSLGVGLTSEQKRSG